MSKLLFFDIDGTLAYPRQTPPQSAVNAIRSAREKGHIAFISTGRTQDSIPTEIAAIGFDGGIFSAGGVVVLADSILVQNHMSRRKVDAIIDLLKDKSVFYVLETPDGRFHSENGNAILAEADMTGVSPELRHLTTEILLDSTAHPMSEYAGQCVFKIAYHSALPRISEELSNALFGLAKVVPFHNIPGLPIQIGEISDPEVNKARAMLDLCTHLGKTAADCIAFGDSMNDSEILETAGIGVAMGNAEESLKAIADIVCDRCENGGIARAMQELGLI